MKANRLQTKRIGLVVIILLMFVAVLLSLMVGVTRFSATYIWAMVVEAFSSDGSDRGSRFSIEDYTCCDLMAVCLLSRCLCISWLL